MSTELAFKPYPATAVLIAFVVAAVLSTLLENELSDNHFHEMRWVVFVMLDFIFCTAARRNLSSLGRRVVKNILRNKCDNSGRRVNKERNVNRSSDGETHCRIRST